MVAAVAALAFGLAACGSSDDDTADAPTGTTPTTPTTPPAASPVAASGDVVGAALQAAFGTILDMPGDSDTVEIAAGMTAVRAGVTFTCDSAYPCTVTVTNSLGTIVATWMSYTLDDGTAGVMASVPHVPVDTFANLNPGNDVTLRLQVTTPTLLATEITGMGLGDSGVLNADMAGLRSSFDPNSPTTMGTADTTGMANMLTGGSTLSGAMTMDGIPASSDMAPAPDGWGMKTLFRDWGDTAGTGDGGFETGAIVVKNLGPGTSQPFDSMLANRYANAGASYAFTVLANGMMATAPAVNTSVAITTSPGAVQAANMVFDSGSLVPAQDQDLGIDRYETFTGSYFGARGEFQCSVAMACALVRNADGTVVLADTDATTAGIQNGTWTFTPAPGATILVPDQDWMVYGAWMTTPDDAANGTHGIGILFNGFDAYAGHGAANVFDATDTNGLHGTATYSGGAAGIYVDGTATGLFTAEATLTANFDVNANGALDPAPANDYSIAGRIDNFRGTDGVYLGTDTEGMPNDPDAGGENDWVVMLGRVQFSAVQNGAIGQTPTSGSADGVPWAGMWNGQLYGAGDVMPMGSPPSGPMGSAPSGVAGQFSAATTAMTPVVGNTAVIGAFGADRDAN